MVGADESICCNTFSLLLLRIDSFTRTGSKKCAPPFELQWHAWISSEWLPSHTCSSHLLFGVSCGENRGDSNSWPIPSVVWRNGTWTFHSNLTVTSSYPGRIQLKTSVWAIFFKGTKPDRNCVECLPKFKAKNEMKQICWNGWMMEIWNQLTLLFVVRCCYSFFVHNREGDDKMRMENEKMQAKLGSV